MAESSDNSATQDKSSITKTSKLTPVQAVEILQEAVIRCQHAGIRAGVKPYYDNGDQGIAIILIDVVLANGNLVLAKATE